MTTAHVNGIDIEYEVHGEDAGEPLLLVMGLGAQLIAWPDGFVELLVDRGYRVVRFDNRDVGLSTKLDGATVDMGTTMAAVMSGQPVDAPYLLADMADDAFGLLDHLGIERAHIVGASMGGMIVQTMAIVRPERVRSMTSIMSTTGDRSVGQPTPEAMAVLMQPPPGERRAYIEHSIATSRVLWGSDTFEFPEEDARRRAGITFDRCFYPAGTARQLVAIMASGDRTEALRGCTVPTLVIHGDADPLVTYSGGEATAAAVPGARIVTVAGMGHTLPEPAWPQIVEELAAHARASAGVVT